MNAMLRGHSGQTIAIFVVFARILNDYFAYKASSNIIFFQQATP
jgi:hypothetical protein